MLYSACLYTFHQLCPTEILLFIIFYFFLFFFPSALNIRNLMFNQIFGGKNVQTCLGIKLKEFKPTKTSNEM